VIAFRAQLAETKEAVYNNGTVSKVLALVREVKDKHGWIEEEGLLEVWHTLDTSK
jgi:NADH:ubiquinone oxidoreductase subunit E